MEHRVAWLLLALLIILVFNYHNTQVIIMSLFQESDFLQYLIKRQTKEAKNKRNEGIYAGTSHVRFQAHAESTFMLKLCPGLTDHEITSQVTIFLAGGYETSTITLMLCAYNLATHPDSMKQLQEEIDATFPDGVRLQPVSHSPLNHAPKGKCEWFSGSGHVRGSDTDGVPGLCHQRESQVVRLVHF